MSLFPIFVKLERRPCLIVGAGNVALEKITSLLRAGAELRVVAPVACDAVRTLADEGRIALELRKFREDDLEGQSVRHHGNGFARSESAGVSRRAATRDIVQLRR